MSNVLDDRSPEQITELLDPTLEPDDKRTAPGDAAVTTAHDLTSIRIQSLAGRGLIDPKSLKLREIQELSASIVAHIRQQHRAR